MFLLAHCVCLLNELAKFLVQILGPLQPEMMDVIMPRNRVDAVETRSIMPMRQDQVANYL